MRNKNSTFSVNSDYREAEIAKVGPKKNISLEIRKRQGLFQAKHGDAEYLFKFSDVYAKNFLAYSKRFIAEFKNDLKKLQPGDLFRFRLEFSDTEAYEGSGKLNYKAEITATDIEPAQFFISSFERAF